MTFICAGKLSPWLGLAAGLFVSAAAMPAFAYTPEQEQACTPDAMRLCGAYIPDVDRITACMIQQRSQLSPECRRYFRPDPPPAAAGPPTDIRPVARKPVSAKSSSAKSSSSKSSSAKSAKAKKSKKPAKPAAT